MQLSALFMILCGLYMLLQPTAPFLPEIRVITFQRVMAAAGQILITTIVLERIFLMNRRKASEWISTAFLWLFLNSLLLHPLLSTFADPVWADEPAIRKYRSHLLLASSLLVPLTGTAALFSTGSLRRVRTWLQNQFIPEGSVPFPGKIVSTREQNPSEIDLSRKVLNWLRNHWLEILLLFILTLYGLYLRRNNLFRFIMDDETHHLAAAMDILQGTPISELIYTRSLYTVTLPLTLAVRFFGETLVIARSVAIFFNVLTVVPLYFLMRRFNRTAALIAVAAYLLNPWMIATARLSREYAFVPFYVYSAAVIMLLLYDAFPSGFLITRDWRKLITFRFLLPSAFLIFLLYFVLIIDPHATIKVITAVYASLGLLLLRKINWKERENLWLLSVPILAVLLFLANRQLLEGQYSGFTFTRLDNYFLSLFFTRPLLYSNPVQQWNYGYGLSSIVIVTLALLSLKFRDPGRFTLPFCLLNFLITLAVFSVFMVPGHKPRYATYIQIWYIPIIAAGLYAAFLLLRSTLKNSIMSALGLFLLFFNLPHIASAHLEIEPYQNPHAGNTFFRSGTSVITNEYLSDPEPALLFLMENMKSGDALVTTSYLKRYFQWNHLDPYPAYVYWYDRDPNKEIIRQAIRTEDEGWIVIDYERAFVWAQPLPLDGFYYAGKHIDMRGWHGDVIVYYWSPIE